MGCCTHLYTPLDTSASGATTRSYACRAQGSRAGREAGLTAPARCACDCAVARTLLQSNSGHLKAAGPLSSSAPCPAGPPQRR